MKRPVFYLLGALVLAAIVVLIERPGGTPGDREGTRQIFKTLDPNKVARIEIERLLDGVSLVREEKMWLVGKGDEPLTPADAAKVSEALTTLQQFTTTSLVSTNPEKQGVFQVNQLGLQVRAYDAAGALLAHVYVGKQGPDFFSTYVRHGGEDRVYLTRTSLSGHFPTVLEYWRPIMIGRPPWLPGGNVTSRNSTGK